MHARVPQNVTAPLQSHQPSKADLKAFYDVSTWPPYNPNEPHVHVASQLYGVHADKYAADPSAIDWSQPPSMSGFAADYVHTAASLKYVQPPLPACPSPIMQSLAPDLLPVFNTLGREYAVCDEWFASVPSQTWTNRIFSAAATSHGVYDNGENRTQRNHVTTQLSLFPTRTIQTHMDEWHGGINYNTDEKPNTEAVPSKWSWAWYTCARGLDLVGPSTSIFSGLWGDEERLSTHYRTFDTLLTDAANGTLPGYSVIEPQYISLGPNSLHNDLHPAELSDTETKFFIRPPIWKAEELILQLYEALFVNGKNPTRTLLVITFDEHGGCYDHIAPPPAHAPNRDHSTIDSKKFHFQRFGVRVPCLLVSPWIKPRTVLRAVEDVQANDHTILHNPPFDHTSLISSVRSKWRLTETATADEPHHKRNATPALTRRDNSAPTFWHVVAQDAVEPTEEAARERSRGLVKELRAKLNALNGYYQIAKPKNAKFVMSELGKDIFMSLLGATAHGAAESHIMTNQPVKDAFTATQSVNLTVVRAAPHADDAEAPESAKGHETEWEEFAAKLAALHSTNATIRPIKLSQSASVSTASTKVVQPTVVHETAPVQMMQVVPVTSVSTLQPVQQQQSQPQYNVSVVPSGTDTGAWDKPASGSNDACCVCM